MVDIDRYLSKFFKGTKDPSLDAMKYFMSKYGHFEKEMKFIHVAGTNGKGSCIETLSSILRSCGLIVGKYMSPHLIRYNERIMIGEDEISDEEIRSFIIELDPIVSEYNLKTDNNVTLFEFETIMALLYFYRKKADIVLLETGLGGQYDCTNIITSPLVSVITSIGFDHMNILGNTLAEIAYEKAGIIKENSSCVFFEQSEEIDKVFIDISSRKNNILHLIKEEQIKNYKIDDDYQYFDFEEFKDIAVSLKGKNQIKNTALCLETIKILNSSGYKISEENIKLGIKKTKHKARLEVINKNPLIIYDGAHNEPAIYGLREMIEMYYKDYDRVYIVSILKTKDYESMIKKMLEDTRAKFIFTSGNNKETYVSGKTLYEVALKYMAKENIAYKNLAYAIKDIFEGDKKRANFFVGSFYVYGDVVDEIKKYNEASYLKN